MKIVFAGTPEFAAVALKQLILSEHAILGVYCQPDKKNGRGQKINFGAVKKLAIENHLPLFQPVDFKKEENIAQLKKLNADILIVAAYGLILPQSVLNLFPLGAINIHASLLPRWRGAAPIARAIEFGDLKTGISIMQMDEGLDTGDVLLQKECPILNTETADELHDKLALLGANLLFQVLEDLENNRIQKTKQNNDFATYAPKITKEEAAINWSENAEKITRKIRAFNSSPGAFTFLNKAIFKIWRAEVFKTNDLSSFPPFSAGSFFFLDKKNILVWCGGGEKKELILLNEVQKAGGKKMPAFQALQNEKAGQFQMGI